MLKCGYLVKNNYIVWLDSNPGPLVSGACPDHKIDVTVTRLEQKKLVSIIKTQQTCVDDYCAFFMSTLADLIHPRWLRSLVSIKFK